MFFKQVDDEYAELQKPQEEWVEEQRELREWHTEDK
jgi:hypothetical protein